MSYSDPSRRQRPPRYQAFAQYGDSFGSNPEARSPSFQDTQVDFGIGRNGGPWDGPERDAPPWGELPRRTTTGGLRVVADGSRQTGGLSRQTGDFPRQTGDFPRQTGDFPRQTGEFPRQSEDSPRQTGGMRLFDDLDEQDGRHGRRGRAAGGGSRGGPGGSRGLLAGGLAGFLAAAVAIGMGNLTAAFVRPQASPIIAVGETFINHTPSALKNFAVEKFGENDKNMLLLGMYVTIALLAIAIGVLAWRRMALGVTGIGLFGLFGAYTAITLPASHASDVIPSVVAGIAGITAIVCLVHAGAWRTSYRSSRSGRSGRSGYRPGWSS
jgi:hypothetical protein